MMIKCWVPHHTRLLYHPNDYELQINLPSCTVSPLSVQTITNNRINIKLAVQKTRSILGTLNSLQILLFTKLHFPLSKKDNISF
jgi:ABC-type enterochelin transport system permease subunit